MTRIKLSWSCNDEDVLDLIHEHLSKTSGQKIEDVSKFVNNSLSALFDRESEDSSIRAAHVELGDAMRSLQELYALIEEADVQMMAYQSYKDGSAVPIEKGWGGGSTVVAGEGGCPKPEDGFVTK